MSRCRICRVELVGGDYRAELQYDGTVGETYCPEHWREIKYYLQPGYRNDLMSDPGVWLSAIVGICFAVLVILGLVMLVLEADG